MSESVGPMYCEVCRFFVRSLQLLGGLWRCSGCARSYIIKDLEW